jgi:hypothetical protein
LKEPAKAKEMERAKRIMKDTTKYDGKGYETGLLWKTDKVSLPDSRPMAMPRLMCLEKQMGKDLELARAMKEKI